MMHVQEIYLSKHEHDKLMYCGYGNTYLSAFRKRPKRGVAILISDVVNFEMIKEINNSEGRYVIVKGKVGNIEVALVNVYIPLDNDKALLNLLLEVIALEKEGILIPAGDLKMILNTKLGTKSNTRKQ